MNAICYGKSHFWCDAARSFQSCLLRNDGWWLLLYQASDTPRQTVLIFSTIRVPREKVSLLCSFCVPSLSISCTKLCWCVAVIFHLSYLLLYLVSNHHNFETSWRRFCGCCCLEICPTNSLLCFVLCSCALCRIVLGVRRTVPSDFNLQFLPLFKKKRKDEKSS